MKTATTGSMSDHFNSEDAKDDQTGPSEGCSLSGLLNVLGGVASQEGRIILMTANFPEKLDDALIRPGRIDKQIYLGHVSPSTAKAMFIGIYADTPDTSNPVFDSVTPLVKEETQELAEMFSCQIPDGKFTPAQVQGYLLRCRDAPAQAAMNVAKWILDEDSRVEEAKLAAENLQETGMDDDNESDAPRPQRKRNAGRRNRF